MCIWLDFGKQSFCLLWQKLSSGSLNSLKLILSESTLKNSAQAFIEAPATWERYWDSRSGDEIWKLLLLLRRKTGLQSNGTAWDLITWNQTFTSKHRWQITCHISPLLFLWSVNSFWGHLLCRRGTVLELGRMRKGGWKRWMPKNEAEEKARERREDIAPSIHHQPLSMKRLNRTKPSLTITS